MGLLTIGAFAKASRLSPKALRLYDELGLLAPARVDPVTGYRLYAPEQLERARLVAWLRRLGMPLARIGEVCDLCESDAAAAAREVRAFWARTEAETAARRDLAAFLIDHLSWKDPVMSPTSSTAEPLDIRYAALSDTGLVRESNQDTAYAGPRLFAVADGFGTGGAPAGEAAVQVLKRLDAEGVGAGVPAGDLLNALEDAVERAGLAVRESPEPTPRPVIRARRSPRCCGPAPGSPWCTSATPAPICCGPVNSSRSPTTTPSSSRWSTKGASARRRPPPIHSARCCCGP